MNVSAPGRRFTLKQMLIAVGVIGVLLGLAALAINGTQEMQRQRGCQNNLRELALTVQNHHDQRGDCPPLAMFNGGLSWAAALQPYLQDQNAKPNLSFDQRYNAPSNSTSSGLKAKQPISRFLFCPSKRRGPQWTDGYPAGDYAVPSVGIVDSDDPTLDDTWMRADDPFKNYGPFVVVQRVPPQTWINQPGTHAKEAANYVSQTSIASWVDGTSNQALFGEKALHPSRVNTPGRGGDFTVFAWTENDYNASGCSRNGARALARSPDELADRAWSRFGSWHLGICQFAFGDGQVRTVRNVASTSWVFNVSNRANGGRIVCY